jgi:hypothetical protein
MSRLKSRFYAPNRVNTVTILYSRRGFGLMIGFIGLSDTPRDYNLHSFLHTHTHTHTLMFSHVFTAVAG